MKLLPKILSGYLVILMILVTINGIMLWNINSTSKAFETIEYESNLENRANQIDRLVYETGYFIRGYLISGEADFLTEYNNRVTNFNTAMAELQQAFSMDTDTEQQARLNKILALYTQWQTEIIAPQIELRQRLDRGAEGVSVDEIGRLVADQSGRDLRDELRNEADLFKTREHQAILEAIENAQSNIRTTRIVSLITAVLAIILGLAIGTYNSRSISSAVGNLSQLTSTFTQGNLGQRSTIQSSDEIGDLSTNFNRMADNLQELIGRETTARRTLEATVTDYVQFVERVARGDLNERLQIHSNGNGDDPLVRLGSNLNHMVDGLANLTQRIEQAAETERLARENLQAMVDEYVQFVASVAEGDLTHRVNSNGNRRYHNEQLEQLGNNLNSMVSSLAEITGQTRQVSVQVASATAEILAATTQQLAAVTEQEASISQTSTTATEVLATVNQTAERAEQVAKVAQRSVEVSQRGQEAVRTSVEGMQTIRHKVEDIAANILALSERTQQIGQIISTVNDIAEQSKVLALNASIEAARAGEEGKSFAVVAMEVRNLAEQSREATDQVRDILSEIQQATNAVVMATEEGIKGVDGGQELINRAGTTIQELANVIRESSQAASQIAASTHQQTVGMNQLTAAMNAIRQASVQTTASVQQAERSAQDLSAMAKQMQNAVTRYKV